MATLARLQREAEAESEAERLQREEIERHDAAEAAQVQSMLEAAVLVRQSSQEQGPSLSCANHCGHYGRPDQENMCSKCFAIRFPDRHRKLQEIKNLTRTQQQIETAVTRNRRRKELETLLAKLKQDKANGLPTPVISLRS
jgi:hypothetical protein